MRGSIFGAGGVINPRLIIFKHVPWYIILYSALTVLGYGEQPGLLGSWEKDFAAQQNVSVLALLYYNCCWYRCGWKSSNSFMLFLFHC